MSAADHDPNPTPIRWTDPERHVMSVLGRVAGDASPLDEAASDDKLTRSEQNDFEAGMAAAMKAMGHVVIEEGRHHMTFWAPASGMPLPKNAPPDS